MTTPTNTDMRAALTEARDWFESQAKAVSKGCGSSYELHDLRTQRDALDAALAAQAQAVPASIITASVMRDDGGEHPAFCLMVAYRAEKDAMTALAMLTDEPAQPATPAHAGDPKALPLAITCAPERIWLDLGFDPEQDDVHFSNLHDLTWSADNATGNGIEYVRATRAARECALEALRHPAVKSNMLVNGGALQLALNVLRRAGKTEVADELECTALAAAPPPPAQAGEYPELPEAMFAKDVASFDPVYLPDDMHAYADATCAARGAAQAAPIEVTDEMALAFHHAISDSSIGQDDVDDTKTGLRAALVNYTLAAQAATIDAAVQQDAERYRWLPRMR